MSLVHAMEQQGNFDGRCYRLDENEPRPSGNVGRRETLKTYFYTYTSKAISFYLT